MKNRAVGAGIVTVALAAMVGCGTGAGGSAGDSPDRASGDPSSASASASVSSSASASASALAASTGARLSSEALQSRWWTWASSEPERTNPVADQDGSACARNQPEDVWFLAGTFGTQAARRCSVPEGVPLAFPLVNVIGEPADCVDFMGAAEGTAHLDGKKVESDVHRGETIVVRSVAGNPVTGGEGRFMTTGCGIWVQLPPLERGDHTLTIRGRAEGFTVGVDYVLTVGAA